MKAVLPMAALTEGEMTLCRVDGVELLIAQVEGQYFAFSSRCSHAGQPLVSGRLVGYQLHCPLHRASFDIRSGKPGGPPATDALITYPVLLESGKIQVDIHR